MISIISAIIGAVLGGYIARRNGGNRLDMAQYAAGFAIAFVLVAMLIGVIFSRLVT